MLPLILQPALTPAYQIPNSLLFRGGQYLTRTPSVASEGWAQTFSCWLRPSAFAANGSTLISAGTSSNHVATIAVSESGGLATFFYTGNGTYVYKVSSGGVLRDYSAYCHVQVVFDFANGIRAERVRLYLNGQRLTDLGDMVFPDQYVSSGFGDAVPHSIGVRCEIPANSTYFVNGCLAEPCFVDGAALAPSHFGEIDVATGSWRPKKPTGLTWGLNGFRLGGPWNFDALGRDYSGRDNDWTSNGFADSDVLADGPTNVYATLNPAATLLSPLVRGPLSNGNLTFTAGESAGGGSLAVSTLALPRSGKWVWTASSTSYAYPDYGLCDATKKIGAGNQFGSLSIYSNEYGPYALCNGAAVNCDGNAASAIGDIGIVAVDVDANKVWIGRCRSGIVVWVGAGNPEAGSSPTFSGPGGGGVYGTNVNFMSVDWFPFIASAGTTNDDVWHVNFGQKSHSVPLPNGFQALCTANMPATTGLATSSFTGNGSADGPFVFTGAVPQTLSINGNAVTWGTHADKLATGFKVRTASAAYNAAASNSWTATYDRKPTVGGGKRAPANAQINP